MGSNKFGKLGLGDEVISEVWEPNLVPDLSKLQMINVSCGENHTLAISSQGDAFSFGDGMFCGIGSVDLTPFPVKIAHHDWFI